MENKFTEEEYTTQLENYLDNLNAICKLSSDEREEATKTFRENWEEEKKKYEKEDHTEKDRYIEVADIAKKMDLPMDWENLYDNDSRTEGVSASTPADALVLSIQNLGKVDIEYMSSITKLSYKDIIIGLKGSIFQNPDTWGECFFKGWETKDEYLSGNLKEKLNTARIANSKYVGYFEDNVKAIEEIMPPAITTDDIYITLSSPWIPVEVIQDFIQCLLGDNYTGDLKNIVVVLHDEITCTWHLEDYSRLCFSVKNNTVYGTSRITALKILEKTLNGQVIEIYDKSTGSSKKNKSTLDQVETALALDKQQTIMSLFKNWVWKNDKRKALLLEIYENKYCCLKSRRYDGSFLTFPGMNKDITLYPYQKDAVARIIFSKNTLLAHNVGSGKTYVMIAAGMELRRIGISKKNLYIVPNNIIGQWRDLFHLLYPSSNVLVVEPKSFTPAKRNKVLEDISNNDYDAIIMAYSCFNLIPLSENYYLEELNSQLVEIERESRKNNNHRIYNSPLNRKYNSLQHKLSLLEQEETKDKATLFFNDLGITGIFLDEAHNYKNVPVEGAVVNFYGINAAGSKKCAEMLDKVKYVQMNNNGGNIVFATGTPITNSLTDLFVMQKYLQEGMLKALDLNHFNNWVSMFAESNVEFEVDVDTSKYRMKVRYSKFHNLPELTSLLSLITDFHHSLNGADLPLFEGYKDVVVTKTDELSDYIKEISNRADVVRSRGVDRNTDNMLKITIDGRKAALDIRLVDKDSPFRPEFKVNKCALNVAKIYHETKDKKSTQLIFSDISIPSTKFNMYDETARLLCEYGVERKDIAFIHNYETDKEREELFEKVRKGDIRILMGSTFKIGTGVNVQDKLIAIHHLDVPWRPSDMIQREGRIIRPGNTNEQVYIYRYITEGSFDAYSWQLLETKQAFINALLSGFTENRSQDDVEDTVLNYAEVKALALGNPLIKQRVEIVNEIRKMVILRDKDNESRERMAIRLENLPEKIKEMEEKYNNAKLDNEVLSNNKVEISLDDKKNISEKFFKELSSNAMRKEERYSFSLNGFSIILPANMIAEHPYVYVKGNGKYVVEMGISESGNMNNLKKFFEKFNTLQDTYNVNLNRLKSEKETIENTLATVSDYGDKIRKLENKMRKINEKLGVVIDRIL